MSTSASLGLSILLVTFIFLAGCARGLAAEAPAVSIVTDRVPGAPAQHGITKLAAALKARGIACEQVDSLAAAKGPLMLVAGRFTGDGAAASLLRESNTSLPAGPEALVIRHVQSPGKPTLLVAGSDDRGLMYAELDVADRIGWAADPTQPFSEVRDITEKPAVSERALSIYTMQRAYFESRFYDPAYWDRYFDTLAQNRFNTFVLIFGYENGGFLAPPYPYFYDTEGFPDIRMTGITPAEQAKNLDALHRLMKQAHDRGLRVTVGIWDHIYRGGVQGGGIANANEGTLRPLPHLVWGVTEKNLTAYTQAALTKFLRLVPEVDAIQFRMHDESGLKNTEQVAFWHAIFEVMKTQAPKVRFDARAKGLPDAVIDDGLALGIPLRITTKYWMEQMALPFHPTHINRQDQLNRRHSYADLLRYPQRYPMHWRLWNGGTARVLLWGDPEFARRFADSTHLYNGDGYEVNEPLATKMEAQPHDAKPFDLLAARYRYTDYEFERYWHFFQVFGRVGYNPDTPAEVWQREFQRRFGKEAAPFVEAGLHRASWVLPRIVAACYPYGYFPMTRGWAEKQRLGDLPAYAKAEGSDTQIFASFDEEAQLLIEKGETAKVRPQVTARWFAQAAADIQAQVAGAQQRIGDRRSKEFDVTLVDLKILANLALFHARRIPAAVSYRLYERTKDPRPLGAALQYEKQAVEAWRQLVAAAGDVYADDLAMGVRSAALCGHWRDELAALETGVVKLEEQWKRTSPTTTNPGASPEPRYQEASADGGPAVAHQPVTAHPAGQPLTITAQVSSTSGVKWVRLRYRGVNQHLDYQTLPMLPTGVQDQYQAVVPAEQIDPKWDFMYLVEALDQAGQGRIWPDLEQQTPYVVVRLRR